MTEIALAQLTEVGTARTQARMASPPKLPSLLGHLLREATSPGRRPSARVPARGCASTTSKPALADLGDARAHDPGSHDPDALTYALLLVARLRVKAEKHRR